MHLVMELRHPFTYFFLKSVDFNVSIFEENNLTNLWILFSEFIVFDLAKKERARKRRAADKNKYPDQSKISRTKPVLEF